MWRWSGGDSYVDDDVEDDDADDAKEEDDDIDMVWVTRPSVGVMHALFRRL